MKISGAMARVRFTAGPYQRTKPMPKRPEKMLENLQTCADSMPRSWRPKGMRAKSNAPMLIESKMMRRKASTLERAALILSNETTTPVKPAKPRDIWAIVARVSAASIVFLQDDSYALLN